MKQKIMIFAMLYLIATDIHSQNTSYKFEIIRKSNNVDSILIHIKKDKKPSIYKLNFLGFNKSYCCINDTFYTAYQFNNDVFQSQFNLLMFAIHKDSLVLLDSFKFASEKFENIDMSLDNNDLILKSNDGRHKSQCSINTITNRKKYKAYVQAFINLTHSVD